MNTLIIHPNDTTTIFLKRIYSSMNHTKVVMGGISKENLRELITYHSRIMMMGHGSPWGLFSVRQFEHAGVHIVDKTMVDVIRTKQNSLYIWCNADVFVKKHQLKGFYSGMFISETHEAVFCGLKNITQDEVDESNNTFSKILSKYVNEDAITIHRNVVEEYSSLGTRNSVARYNSERLYAKC